MSKLPPAAQARMAASRATIEKILAAGANGLWREHWVRQARRMCAFRLKSLLNCRPTWCAAMQAAWGNRSGGGGIARHAAVACQRTGQGIQRRTAPALVELLVGMLNAGVHPVIPEKGSVGASGDLAPLGPPGSGGHRRGRGDISRRAHCWRGRAPAGCAHGPSACCQGGTGAA